MEDMVATLKFTRALQELLADRRVFLDWHPNSVRTSPESLTFVDQLHLEGYSGIYAGSNLAAMGAFSYSHSPLNPYLRIGRFCSISWGLTVTGPRHPVEWLSTSNIGFDSAALNVAAFHEDFNDGNFNTGDPRQLERPYPQIGNDVWIGQNVVINRGVTVGHGAVIAAFSVITRDVPPYAIVGGNPAKIIRLRFPSEVVDRLLASAWWQYNPRDFAHNKMSDVEAMLAFFEREAESMEPFTPPVLTGADIVEAYGSDE
ncbi:CatB-related O-acetyltransferase [Tessaracoccus sp. SD287]|nr:CatB-related O-acetyltransferase [Tessaracoccus sp. SD287]